MRLWISQLLLLLLFGQSVGCLSQSCDQNEATGTWSGQGTLSTEASSISIRIVIDGEGECGRGARLSYVFTLAHVSGTTIYEESRGSALFNEGAETEITLDGTAAQEP